MDRENTVQFLLAVPRVVTCAQAGRVQPDGPRQASYDALTRLLQRLEPNVEPVWLEAEQLLDRTSGLLIALDNLKLLDDLGWHWLTRLKSNRHVNPDGTDNVRLLIVRFVKRERACMSKATVLSWYFG